VEEANVLHGELTSAIDAAIASTQETMSQVEGAADLTRQTLGELESSVTELTGRVTQLGEDTLGKAGDLAQKITDDVTSRAEGLFGDVTQALGSDFFDQAVAGFEGLTSNVDNLYENFDSMIAGLGDNVMNRLQEVFMNTINHAQDEAAGKIEQEIQNLVEDAIAFVAEEIASNFTMATAGSATTAALGQAFPTGRGVVLLARADLANPELGVLLRDKGWETTEVVAYHTVPVGALDPAARRRLDRGEVDWVAFTASCFAEGFLRGYGGPPPPGVRVAAIGPVTADTARSAGIQVATTAAEHTIGGLVAAA